MSIATVTTTTTNNSTTITTIIFCSTDLFPEKSKLLHIVRKSLLQTEKKSNQYVNVFTHRCSEVLVCQGRVAC